MFEWTNIVSQIADRFKLRTDSNSQRSVIVTSNYSLITWQNIVYAIWFTNIGCKYLHKPVKSTSIVLDDEILIIA
jgi:hypothetical protein